MGGETYVNNPMVECCFGVPGFGSIVRIIWFVGRHYVTSAAAPPGVCVFGEA